MSIVCDTCGRIDFNRNTARAHQMTHRNILGSCPHCGLICRHQRAIDKHISYTGCSRSNPFRAEVLTESTENHRFGVVHVPESYITSNLRFMRFSKVTEYSRILTDFVPIYEINHDDFMDCGPYLIKSSAYHYGPELILETIRFGDIRGSATYTTGNQKALFHSHVCFDAVHQPYQKILTGKEYNATHTVPVTSHCVNLRDLCSCNLIISMIPTYEEVNNNPLFEAEVLGRDFTLMNRKCLVVTYLDYEASPEVVRSKDNSGNISVPSNIGKMFITRDLLTRKLIFETYWIPNRKEKFLLKNCKVPIEYFLGFVGGTWNISPNNDELLPIQNLL